MPIELFADNAATTLTSSPSAGGTSFTVASSTGFPAAATGVGQFRVLIGTEIVTVTNVSGTTWTCNALAASHTSGDAVTHVVTAAGLGNLGAGGGDYFRTGYYSSGQWQPAALSSLGLSLNIAVTCPFVVPVRRAFDRIGVNVITAATAASGGVLRFGLYADGGGQPGTLLLDAGTISSESLGAKEITIAQTLNPGTYWLACVAQVAVCTVTSYGANMLLPMISASTTPLSTASLGAFRKSAVSGALPDPFAANSNSNNMPLVGLRAA